MKSNVIQDLIRKAKEDNDTGLNLSSKGLDNVPSEVFELVNLEQLSLSFNNLTFLPPEISKLKNLKKLFLHNNQLTCLPSEISELENLTEIFLTGNKLTKLPPEILKLKHLKRLFLSSNNLTELPSEISKLKNLIEFDLSHNQLTSIPYGISKLRNLTSLDLRSNQLNSLPPEILELEMDINWEAVVAHSIFVGDNPFEEPPIEIVKMGKMGIFNYYNLIKEETEQLNEVKVLLVGEGAVGKTSLVKCLLGENLDGTEAQTQGISIRPWVVREGKKTIKVNLWDFGGQEIMHATHQFFLSKRSLYILVLDSRRDDNAEYWLQHIRSFGGESPILIVINKIDENPGFDLNRKFLMEKYPSIKGFYRVSCKMGFGIEIFTENLKQELAHVKHIQIHWSKSWFGVKAELEQMNREFISYASYKKICEKYGIREKSSQNTLLAFLSDLGIVVYFKDIQLLDTYILEPKWITEAVYKIINSYELAYQNGILKFDRLDHILRKKDDSDFYYSPNKYNFIINLMKKFELCYEIDEETMLLPDLLQVQEPAFDFDYNSALRFIIEYAFLPKSVMPRFIVKMNRDIKNNLQWRTGIVLENKDFNSCAVIKSDNEAKRIYINVNGNQKRDYFSSILFNLREINQSFMGLKAIEKICIPDEPEIYVGYDHLISLERRGIQQIFPEGAHKAYDIKNLLGFGETNISNELEEEKILKILKELLREKEHKFSELPC